MRNLFFVIAMFFVGVVNSQVIKIEAPSGDLMRQLTRHIRALR